jgi:dTDP-glucose pyrophosphorylase
MGGNQKTIKEIKGKPILYWNLKTWSKDIGNMVFITGHQHEETRETIVKVCKELDINPMIAQNDWMGDGLGGALRSAEAVMPDRFMLILGDCICRGLFSLPDAKNCLFVDAMEVNPEKIKTSYAVLEKDNQITRVIEKPTLQLMNQNMGMGYYLLDKNIFKKIPATARNTRTGKIELTDILQTAISMREDFKAANFYGDYVNVNTPDDFKRAEEIIGEHDGKV